MADTELVHLLEADLTDPHYCPPIDYRNLPFRPREGVQTPGNNKYATRSLFLETAPSDKEEKALWCMSEHEIWAHGRWYPSAWMAYIYAVNEYDALRKICGNVKQWGYIKEMFEKTERGHILEAWQLEQQMLQEADIQSALLRTATTGGPGAVAAAKQFQTMTRGKAPVGRPKKEAKPSAGEQNRNKAGEEAMKRVLDFSSRS